MTKTFLKSSTAFLMGLSLAMPGAVTAQSAAGRLPPCVNADGEVWTDQLRAQAGTVSPRVPDAGAGGMGGQFARCVFDDGGQKHVFTGQLNDAGGVVVGQGDLLAVLGAPSGGADNAAEAGAADAGNEAGNEASAEPTAEPQDDTAMAAQETPAPEPEATPEVAEESSAPEPRAEAEMGAGRAGSDVSNDGRSETAPEGGSNAGEAAQVEVQQDDTAESTAAANATVEAQASANADTDTDQVAEGAEVETQTVTEADTRKSDEDFGTAVTAKAGAKKDGLSDFEKFAIGAIGAVAVGAMLSNGKKVVANSGDRVVVQREDGEYEVLKDDNVLLRRPGVEVRTERFNDGSTRETIYRKNGARVVTVKAANGQVLSRVRVTPEGQEVVLFDDTSAANPVTISALPKPRQRAIATEDVTADELRLALAAQDDLRFERSFSLQQIRQIRAVRELVPVIELEAVTFDTGSAAIRASEAEELRVLGDAMQRLIERNPYEVFLVEGHTDAVGNATYNLALSDRRAESVALALTEYFDVPPENMVVQGYGESNLKIRTSLAERENRRATVRRITPLLRTASTQ